MRKIIHVCVQSDELWALCDDGTVWAICDGGTRWQMLPPIPQDQPAEVLPPLIMPAPRWPPYGIDQPIWAVATAGDHAMALDGPDSLTDAINSGCVFVEGRDAADALTIYAVRDVRTAYVQKYHVTVGGSRVEYLSQAIPF